ncbi:hypothetical protein I4U23_015372 [Adineta vaga]|nr:hypothetical protein I4U23_015372 [Adineta vaga]
MFYLRLLITQLFLVFIIFDTSVIGGKTKLVTYTVTLSANEKTDICCDAELQVNSIQDGRCPIKVLCVWAGQAKVDLLLSNKEDSSAIELIIGAQPKSNAVIAVGSKSYNVTLVNVTPYPGTNNNPLEAIIQVICA